MPYLCGKVPKGLNRWRFIRITQLLVESGKVQPTVRDALESTYLEGNPWNKAKAIRYDWMDGLDVKLAEPDREVENLFSSVVRSPMIPCAGNRQKHGQIAQ